MDKQRETTSEMKAAVIDSTSDEHLHQFKNEFSFSDPQPCGGFEEHVTVNQVDSSIHSVLQIKSEVPDLKCGILTGNDDIYIKLQPLVSEELHVKDEVKASLEDTNDTSIQSLNLQIKSEVPDLKCGILTGNDDIYIKLQPLVSEELHVKDEVKASLEDTNDTSIQSLNLQIKSEVPDLKCGILTGNDDIYIKLQPLVSEELHVKDEVKASLEDTNDTSIQSLNLQIKSEVPDLKCGILTGNDDIYIKLQPLVSEELHVKDEVKASLEDTNDTSIQSLNLQIKSEVPDLKCGILTGNDDIYIKLQPLVSEELHVKDEVKASLEDTNDTSIQSLNLQIKSEVPDLKCGIISANDDISIKLELLVSEELHIKSEVEEKMSTSFKCSVCDYSCIRKSALELHIKTHTGKKPFRCDVCDYSCMWKSNLQRHVKIHTGEKPLKCNICDYSCLWRMSLNNHMITHTGGKPLKCNVCNYSSKWKSSLNQHMKTHTGNKPFHCNVCDYKCIRKTTLRHHIKTHTGDKPFQCDVCAYGSLLKRDLQNHMQTHTGEKKIKCNVCGYRCILKKCLQEHMRTHTGEKPFHCNVCDYKFTQKSNLRRHLKLHTGEAPFKCNVCNYRCVSNSLIQEHIRIHTGEKPYQCAMCDYSCAQKSSLRKHINIHIRKKTMTTHTGEKPFKCNVCEHSCKLKTDLQRHMQIHTGEKTFKCSVCDYSCIQKISLQQHMNKHTGEKPYKCRVCDFSSIWKSNLQQHFKTHARKKL